MRSSHCWLEAAVDAQPDGTVARKRFWRGNFLFVQDPALGSPGFKRFRPIIRDSNGNLRRLTNEEIAGKFDLALATVERRLRLIRKHWRGFSGGTAVWDEINRFFVRLKQM